MLSWIHKTLSVAKKVFIVIAIYFAVVSMFLYFNSKDKALITQTAATDQSREAIYSIVNDPQQNATKTGRAGIAFYRVVMCSMIGEACTKNPKDGDKNFNHSLFGFATNLIVLPYQNPPASGLAWAYSGLQNAGFVPKSYAAEGIGFASIKPYQNLWKIFRDFAYIVLVLILITIGFMIMFRLKVNPQTVITLENSLPRIVIALILITFSYAIAGFMIDLMYSSMVIGISIISKANIGDINPSQIDKLQNRFIGARLNELWPYGGNPILIGNSLINILPSVIRGLLKGVIAFTVSNVLAKMWAWGPKEFFDNFKGEGGTVGALTAVFGFDLGNIPGTPGFIIQLFIFLYIYPYLAGFLVGLIFCFTLLFFMVKIFFLLLVSYLRALLFIIFSPVLLLMEAIPGRKAFTTWIRHLAAELIVFPLVVLLMLVGNIIIYTPVADGAFKPPFLYGIDPSAFTAIVGMGLVLLIPEFIKKAKEVIGGKGLGIPFGPSVFFAGITGIGGGALGGVHKLGSAGYTFQYLQNLPFIGQRLPDWLKPKGGH